MSRRDYTSEEITAGLLALVMWAGNEAAAARALRAQGYHVPASTLRGWKTSRSDEYNALRERHARDLEDELVRRLREASMHAISVQQKAIQAAEKRLDEKKDIQPAQTAAALSKSATTSIDKLLALTGRPSQITEHRSPEEILRGLVQQRVVTLIDPQPAELPSEGS